MAFENFKPTIWETAIEKELERLHVFVADTNQKYTGEVKQRGDQVRILSAGRPQITTINGDKDVTLADPEVVEDSTTTLKVDHMSYFNFYVGDIDKAQANGEIEAYLKGEATAGLNDEMDKLVSRLSLDPQAKKLFTSAEALTAANVLTTFDKALEALYENDVPMSEQITFTIAPWVYTLFKQAYINHDTDNSDYLVNGKVARYGNALIRVSNNITQDKNGNDLIQVKTNRAIGFANPLTHLEPYRPEKKFGDAVKGFTIYGGKIIRPKEMVIVNCKRG